MKIYKILCWTKTLLEQFSDTLRGVNVSFVYYIKRICTENTEVTHNDPLDLNDIIQKRKNYDQEILENWKISKKAFTLEEFDYENHRLINPRAIYQYSIKLNVVAEENDDFVELDILCGDSTQSMSLQMIHLKWLSKWLLKWTCNSCWIWFLGV